MSIKCIIIYMNKIVLTEIKHHSINEDYILSDLYRKKEELIKKEKINKGK